MKKIVIAILIILAAVILYFYFGLSGNPISKELGKYSVEQYIEENYPGEDYNLTDISYNFKTSKYEFTYKKPNSLDEYFHIYTDSLGRIKYDDYEEVVSNKWNTYNRLYGEIKNQTDFIFNDIIDVDDNNYGYIGFKYKEGFEKKLILNQELDIRNPPLELELVLVKYDSVVNYEALAKLLIQIEDSLIEYGIKADYYDVVLREYRFLDKEDGLQVYAYGLKYEDWVIYKEDIEELAGFLKEYRENWDSENLN